MEKEEGCALSFIPVSLPVVRVLFHHHEGFCLSSQNAVGRLLSADSALSNDEVTADGVVAAKAEMPKDRTRWKDASSGICAVRMWNMQTKFWTRDLHADTSAQLEFAFLSTFRGNQITSWLRVAARCNSLELHS